MAWCGGVINSMIVIPMLIETVSFGAVYSNLLGGNPTDAIMFAGALLFIAACLMLWIRTPRGEEEVEPPVESTAPAARRPSIRRLALTPRFMRCSRFD